jgi:hypothetical protein
MDWKKIRKYANYGLYVFPIYGLIDQYKKPKEERSKAGVIFSDILLAGFVVKLAVLYGGKVAATGNWNPFDFNHKEKKEQIDGNLQKNKKCLEKNVYYEDIILDKTDN